MVLSFPAPRYTWREAVTSCVLSVRSAPACLLQKIVWLPKGLVGDDDTNGKAGPLHSLVHVSAAVFAWP